MISGAELSVLHANVIILRRVAESADRRRRAIFARQRFHIDELIPANLEQAGRWRPRRLNPEWKGDRKPLARTLLVEHEKVVIVDRTADRFAACVGEAVLNEHHRFS